MINHVKKQVLLTHWQDSYVADLALKLNKSKSEIIRHCLNFFIISGSKMGLKDREFEARKKVGK